MKNSIIEEIYLSLNEKKVMSDEYKKLTDEAFEFYEQLNGVLSDEQKRFLKIMLIRK